MSLTLFGLGFAGGLLRNRLSRTIARPPLDEHLEYLGRLM
jgi:hypothetical protein